MSTTSSAREKGKAVQA
jgi:hypothetical protein